MMPLMNVINNFIFAVVAIVGAYFRWDTASP